MRVPGAENAYVDPAKVRNYLLSIEHPVGHRKAVAVDAMLQGPAGRSAHVVSVWIVRHGEEFPRLVTAYPGVFG
jgi:hypothetical protein